MRKMIALGLLALCLVGFSSATFAGGVEDCVDLKQSGLKSLYGLCVAWHNADDDAKDFIAQKFRERFGEEVPGSEATLPDDPETGQDFYCPCWEEVSITDVCALGAPITANVGEGFGLAAFRDLINFRLEGFGTNAGEAACAHSIQDMSDASYILLVSQTGLTFEEILDCQSEVEAIATMYISGNCL